MSGVDQYLDSLTRPRPRSKAPAQEGPDLFAMAVGSIEGGDRAAMPVRRGGVVGRSDGSVLPSKDGANPTNAHPSDLDSQQSPAFDLSEGVRRKEAALNAFNEKRAELMEWLRGELADLCRDGIYEAVTADHAVNLLAGALRCRPEDAPTGAWMGALFRSSEWEFSHWTVSERTSNNGRSLRAWRLR